jgi:hypothetical protein
VNFRNIISKHFSKQVDGNGRSTSNNRSIKSGRLKLDGFTMISNIQLECIILANLTKNELRLLLYLLRNITGWTDSVPDGFTTVKRKDGRTYKKKKFKRMARTQMKFVSRQIARELNIHQSRFLEAKNGLLSKQMIIENGANIQLNLVPDEWVNVGDAPKERLQEWVDKLEWDENQDHVDPEEIETDNQDIEDEDDLIKSLDYI